MATLIDKVNEVKTHYGAKQWSWAVNPTVLSNLGVDIYRYDLHFLDDKGIIRYKRINIAVKNKGTPEEMACFYNENYIPSTTPPPETFIQKLIKKLNEHTNVNYYEILNSNDNLKKARVFIQTTTNIDKFIIAYIDAAGNLAWTDTTFGEIEGR